MGHQPLQDIAPDADQAPEGVDDCEEVTLSDMSDDERGEVGQDHGGVADHAETPNDGDSQAPFEETLFDETLVDDNGLTSGEGDMGMDESSGHLAEESMPPSQLVPGEPDGDDDDDDVICIGAPTQTAEDILATRKCLENKISELHAQLSNAKKMETAKTFGILQVKLNINSQTNSYSYVIGRCVEIC